MSGTLTHQKTAPTFAAEIEEGDLVLAFEQDGLVTHVERVTVRGTEKVRITFANGHTAQVKATTVYSVEV